MTTTLDRLPKPDYFEDTILVTHRGCLDGSGCAIMFLAAGGLEENIHYIAAGSVERFIKKNNLFKSDKFIIFADVGLNDASYCEKLEKRGDLVFIDHHKTSQCVENKPWAYIDMEGCGTTLLRNYLLNLDIDVERDTSCFGRVLNGQSYIDFSNMIDDHDRWLLRIPEAFDLADLMSFMGQDEFVKRFKNPWERSQSPKSGKKFINEFEAELLKLYQMRRDDLIDEVIKKAIIRNITLPDSSSVTVAYVVSSLQNTSMMLDKLLKTNNEVSVAAQVNIDRGMVSLRSRNGYDVSKMASYFGGGGHAAASGHRINKDILDSIIEEVHFV